MDDDADARRLKNDEANKRALADDREENGDQQEADRQRNEADGLDAERRSTHEGEDLGKNRS
jgi:hypothetical protein